ncbi:30S ribosomal protein S7 [bacterium]|nr:30S ribosomal protein S7 [bacterium]
MPRRRVVTRREIANDAKYNDQLMAKFINKLMRDGKRNTAERILYKALDMIQSKTKEDPVQVFKQAVSNVKPVLEVKSRRVGGATYQVPVEIRPQRRITLAIRWIIGFASQQKGKTMVDALANELIDAANNRGLSIKKKDDTHKMAEANKAFAHYKW